MANLLAGDGNVADENVLLAAILLSWIAGRVRATLGTPHPGWRWFAHSSRPETSYAAATSFRATLLNATTPPPGPGKSRPAAAAFLEFLQSPERLKALHERTGWLPTSSKFDTSVLTDPQVVAMWKQWTEGENIPYIANVVPGQFYEQALLPAAQQVVQGEITGEEAGALAAKVAKEWRDFNPDMVDNYRKWAADLAG